MKIKMIEEKGKEVLYACIALAALLAVWEVLALFINSSYMLPSPVTVFHKFFLSFVVPIGSETLPQHIGVSLVRVVIGYLAATLLGLITGLGMAWSKIVDAIVKPIFEFFRPIPPLAWIPMAIIWFGIGESTKYFIIFIATYFTITLNAYTGARDVDPELIGAGKMLGASNWHIFFTIIIPGSIPQIFAGLQVALSSGWMAVLAAEMVRSSNGAGWIIIRGMEVGDTVQIMVGMIAIGIVGFILATIMRKIEGRCCRWNEPCN